MKIIEIIRTRSQLTGGLFILLLGSILMTPNVQANQSEQQAKREANFRAADADGNGALSQAEFQTFIDANADDNLGHASKIRRFGAYERAFKKVDKDNNGTVSWSEVMEGLAESN
jgi:Ca2+-binding EF-hand superfamily protein